MSTQTHESSSREARQRVEEGLEALRVGLGSCVMCSTRNANRGGGKSVPEAVWDIGEHRWHGLPRNQSHQTDAEPRAGLAGGTALSA